MRGCPLFTTLDCILFGVYGSLFIQVELRWLPAPTRHPAPAALVTLLMPLLTSLFFTLHVARQRVVTEPLLEVAAVAVPHDDAYGVRLFDPTAVVRDDVGVAERGDELAFL